MKLYHGSYKEIQKFEKSPIWCSNLFDTANSYILCQSEGENGEFGYIYEIEINESEIITIQNFVSVDCGSILNEIDGNIFTSGNEDGDIIFLIRDSSKYTWKSI
jgi:hypothetical protein